MSGCSSASIPSRLREREEARQHTLEKRRAEKQEQRRPEETAEHFTTQLEAKKDAVAGLLRVAESLAKESLPPHFEEVFSKCSEIQKLISDSSLFLSAYDRRTAHQQITALLQLANSKQSQLLPKKKFSFLTRKKEGGNMPDGGVKVQSNAIKEPYRRKEIIADKSKVISGREDENFEMMCNDVIGLDLHLTGLKGCEIRLLGPPSTLHMTHMSHCTVLCGPVSSSVFIEDCCSCIFVVACQQLRIHASSSSSFYTHVTSRAVIEDCQQVSFAPYEWSYPSIDAHFELSGLDRSTNNWRLVHDFNWLSSQEPSPNWQVLPEHERTSFSEGCIKQS